MCLAIERINYTKYVDSHVFLKLFFGIYEPTMYKYIAIALTHSKVQIIVDIHMPQNVCIQITNVHI